MTVVSRFKLSKALGPMVGIVVLTGVGNLLTLLYQIVIGRSLGPEAYSLFSSIFVLVGVIGVATSGLQIAAAQAIAGGRATDEQALVDPFTRQAVLLGVAAGTLLLLATPLLTTVFRIGWVPFLVVSLYVPVAVLLSVVNGRFQGRGLILACTAFSAVLAVAKLLSTFPVIVANLGTTSFLAMFLLSCLAMAVAGLVLTRAAGTVRSSALSPDVVRGFTTMTLFWFLSNVDIVAARALLSESDAGQWAAASMLAKSALILPGVVALAVLPVAVRHRREGRKADRLAIQALLLTLLAAALPALLMLPLGHAVVGLFYGAAFDEAGNLAGRIALAIVPLALAQVLLQFHLARERGTHLITLGAVAVILPIAFWAGERSPEGFVLALAVAAIVTLVGLVPLRKWRLIGSMRGPSSADPPTLPLSVLPAQSGERDGE
jgi:O-antigen/teichoic acid export membrane protein